MRRELREVKRLFPGVDFATIPNVGANGYRLCLEAVLWAADCFNCSPIKANIGWRSPSEVFFSRMPELQVILCLRPGMMRVARDAKFAVQSVRYFFLNNGCNHPSSAVKAIKASTGGICYTRDAVWTVPRVPLQPVPAVGRGAVGHSLPVSAAAPGFTITYEPAPSLVPPPPPPPQPSLSSPSPLHLTRPSPPLPSLPLSSSPSPSRVPPSLPLPVRVSDRT